MHLQDLMGKGQIGQFIYSWRHIMNRPASGRVAFKMAASSPAMSEREELLSRFALLVKEGALGLRSCEELKEVILHHFGVRKHEMYVYRSNPHPFIVIFF
jgi:hypothetical protein